MVSKSEVGRVAHFQRSLSRVVELGYGDDECQSAVVVMFDEVIRESVPFNDLARLPFKLPVRMPDDRNTYAELLRRATALQQFVDGQRRREPFVFPFLTTLGISGGVFLLAFHVARLMPLI